MDIRNFFGPKGGAKPLIKKDFNEKINVDKKKRANVISDSDSDEDIEKKPKVPKQASPVLKKSEVKQGLPKPNLKEVNASDFFGSTTSTKSKTSTTPSIKRKSPECEKDR